MDAGMSYSSEVLQSTKTTKKCNKSPPTPTPLADSVCLTYQKLVVPMKMRSIYWKGFGFPANEKGEILTRMKIVCLFCQTSIAYNRNTSNLRMHLESKHRAKLMELEASAPPKQKLVKGSKKTSSNSVFEIDPSSGPEEHVYEANLRGNQLKQEETSLPAIQQRKSQGSTRTDQIHEGSNPSLVEIVVPNLSAPEEAPLLYSDDEIPDFVESAIAEFIVTDLISPCVVEGIGFKNLLHTLRPGLVYRNKAKYEDQLLPQCHIALRDSVIEELSAAQQVGVTIEEWKSGSGQIFFTISVHFQKDSEEVESRLLSSFQIPIDINKWALLILETLLLWNVKKENVIAVVIASKKHEKLIADLKSHGVKALPCFIFALQEAVDKCFNIDVVPHILSKCYMIQQALNHTPLLTPEGSNEANDDEEEEVCTSSPHIWTSVYHLLKLLVSIGHDAIGLKLGIENLHIEFSGDDWEKIKIIVEILQPFTVILKTLKEEKVSSIALIRPFLFQMISSHLKDVHSDSDFETILKLTLREELSNFYADESIDLLLKITSFLDPRFKSLPFNQGDEFNEVTAEIKKLLENIIEDNDTNSPDISEKKPRLSGIGLLLGNVCSPSGNVSKLNRAQQEMTCYQCEQAASFDVCPLQWWSATRTKCPNLCRLAYNFSCVPASSVPSHLIDVSKRIQFNSKRARINSEHVNTVLFLHANQNLFSFQDQ